jgi:hypothetical protein
MSVPGSHVESHVGSPKARNTVMETLSSFASRAFSGDEEED